MDRTIAIIAAFREDSLVETSCMDMQVCGGGTCIRVSKTTNFSSRRFFAFQQATKLTSIHKLASQGMHTHARVNSSAIVFPRHSISRRVFWPLG